MGAWDQNGSQEDWLGGAQDSDWWRADVSVEINLWVLAPRIDWLVGWLVGWLAGWLVSSSVDNSKYHTKNRHCYRKKYA
jgi:hypothetical protein